LIWIRIQRNIYVLNFGSITQGILGATTIVNVNMAPHVLAEKIAHHWRSIIVRSKFSPFQLKDCVVGTGYTP
jgi:hypothetical protein